MKKIKILLILFISIFILNLKVKAGVNLSVSTTSVTKGETFTASVNMWDAAAWNIHVTSSGPVSGCSINQADATADAMDTSKTFTATCTATGTGTINISLSGDVTSANDGIAVMLSGGVSVNVVEPALQPSNPTPSSPQPQQPQNNLSNNNNIKDLSIAGYELIRIDNNNYTLTVSNNVAIVNVNATAEDSKANVVGGGTHELKVGENNIEIIVTSESGAQNKINIKVIRKDGYYLEDLDSVLKNNKIKDVDIIINIDSNITKEEIEKIKNSKKTLRLNYYDENKKLVYSWTLDGSKIDKTNEFITEISSDSEEVENISKLSNYADGLYVNFKHSGKLPKGTKVKLYVGEKYEDGSIVNIYHYIKGKNQLEDIKKDVKVTNGYIEFDVEHCSEYFITKSNLTKIDNNDSSSVNIFMILSIIEFIIIIVLIGIYFFKLKAKEGKINYVEIPTEENVESNLNSIESVKTMAEENIESNLNSIEPVKTMAEENIESNLNSIEPVKTVAEENIESNLNSIEPVKTMAEENIESNLNSSENVIENNYDIHN